MSFDMLLFFSYLYISTCDFIGGINIPFLALVMSTHCTIHVLLSGPQDHFEDLGVRGMMGSGPVHHSRGDLIFA